MGPKVETKKRRVNDGANFSFLRTDNVARAHASNSLHVRLLCGIPPTRVPDMHTPNQNIETFAIIPQQGIIGSTPYRVRVNLIVCQS